MKKIYSIYWSLVVVLLAACGDYFDQPGDGDAVDRARFFSDESAYRQVITDAYMQLRDTALYGGTLTLTLLEEAGGLIEAYDVATAAMVRNDWENEALSRRLAVTKRAMYRVVASCDDMIDAVRADQLKSAEVRMAVGEAYGLRAAVSFDLYRLFDEGVGLSTVNEDLYRAASLLRTTDPLVTTTSQTAVAVGQQDRRLRTLAMNWYAVKAVQARVALWERRYADAIAAVDSILSPLDTLHERYQVYYFVEPGKYGADYCFSREFLFGIATRPDGFAALSDRLFVEGDVRTTSRLRSIYADAADIRYRAWFRPSADGQGYTMARKFGRQTLLSGYVVSQTGSETMLPASIPFIKLGECLLIAAEALNESGQTEEALALVERLEAGKDCPGYAAHVRDLGVTHEAVSRLIDAACERELFGEGQLYYYQKRKRR